VYRLPGETASDVFFRPVGRVAGTRRVQTRACQDQSALGAMCGYRERFRSPAKLSARLVVSGKR